MKGFVTKPCVVCRTPLQNVDHPARGNQPYGTEFVTRGHYGSTVIDTFENRTLKINLCDPCLLQAIADGIVFDSDAIRIWLK